MKTANESVQKRLEEKYYQRRANISLFREHIESYDGLTNLSSYIRKDLTKYWDNRIEKEIEQCEILKKLIQRGLPT